MQYLRQSLLTICICLYTFMAVALGLNFLVGRVDKTAAVGFYHPDLAPDIFEVVEAEDSPTSWVESVLQASSDPCLEEICF
ncbi:hypothetical protein [Pseudanabaena sp. FACHB-2040]|uniref:hypothetical protein n=1 Tax=Pseudanabaena sp. FACHB-2040 TaxID=2692859 RepID=UPI0016897776|nr:hypothetical protein [Pseudanabaena sp. FACHB-2040]MBD2260270.1 hypothetical protein [Pseudanabaena sp. FACHB-2040]